jgi:hypothetical protein
MAIADAVGAVDGVGFGPHAMTRQATTKLATVLDPTAEATRGD